MGNTLLCFFLTRIFGAFASQVAIKTPNGVLIGDKFRTDSGRDIFTFRGVPYAQPPEGDLRWKLPVAKSPWKDPWDARQFRWMCPQVGKYQTYSREDCLYLNIITPTLQTMWSLPVMFWIHGGGFKTGSSAEFPVRNIGKNLASRQVVVVTINYRMGVFGFFSTHGYAAPGNLAFHDQLLALQWIRQNIHLFGGDPEKITLFGQGAGSKSVALHTVSPLSKGLFRRAILQGGFSSQLRIDKADMNFEISLNISLRLGCAKSRMDWETPRQKSIVLTCMMQKPVEEVLERTSEFEKRPGFEWEPLIDGHFLPESLNVLIANRGKMDIIIGVNRDESGKRSTPAHCGYAEDSGYTKRKLVDEIIKVTKKIEGKNEDLIQRLTTALYADGVQEFFGVDITDDYNYFWLDQTIKLHTESEFGGPVIQEISSFLNTGSKVYFYQFDYLSPSAFTPSPWRVSAESPSRYLSLKPDLEMKEMFSQRSVNFWGSLVPDLVNLNIHRDPAKLLPSDCFDWIYLWLALSALFVLIVFCFALICLFEKQNIIVYGNYCE